MLSRRRLLRAAIAAVVVLVVLVAGSYLTTWTMDVQSPPTLLRIRTMDRSEVGSALPYRRIPASRSPVALPVRAGALPATVPWKGKRITVRRFLDTTHSRALLVVRDGALIHEWYGRDTRATTRMSSWSMAKSLVSLLIGQSIEAGRLRQEDRLVDLLPQFRTGGSYDQITVRHLLDMASGVDVPENQSPWKPFTGTARMYITKDLPAFLRDHRKVGFTPGSKGDYRSVDTALLGLILAKAEGRPLAALLAERLWEPVGAQDGATWNLDRQGGTEKAFCCVNATARDFAKIGLLVLGDGRASGRQVVPRGWIKRISTPAPHPVRDSGYSAQWWIPAAGELAARGIHGQFVHVNRATRTVVVKLGDHPVGKDRAQMIAAVRALAA